MIFVATALFFLPCFVYAEATDAQLISAAKSGDIKTISNLLGQGLKADTVDKSGNAILLLAAANGKYAAAELLINEGANFRAVDTRGNTILHLLASSSKKEAVALMQLAINKGAIIDALNFKTPRQTPAEIAISKGNIPVVELLLNNGVGVDNVFRNNGNKPMAVYAYESGQIPVMKFIIEKGASIDSENAGRDTLLHMAVLKNDISTVKYLTEKKAALDKKGSTGRTALLMAADKGYLKIAEFLLQNGCSADAVDYSGKNIMHLFAPGKNNGKTISAFSGYGVDINKKDSYGITPILAAINSKRWENVQPLIDAGAEFKFVDNEEKTLLVKAIENKNSSLALYLIGKGIDVKKKNSSGRTALHAAAGLKGKDWDKIITLIIQRGENVNDTDNSGVSPAGIAIESENSSGFKILLDNGLDINLKERGTDPLVLYAYKRNAKSAFTELVKKGADTSLKDGAGNSILHLVAEKDDRTFYNTLAPLNPDLNIKNSAGKTPLFLAIEKGKLQFAKMLLDQKGKIDLKARDGQQMSIFHYLASAKGGITLLSAIETDPQQVSGMDASGRTPLALAVHANLVDNAAFFIKNGADPKGEDWLG